MTQMLSAAIRVALRTSFEHRVHEAADAHRERVRRLVLLAVRTGRGAVTRTTLVDALHYGAHDAMIAIEPGVLAFGATIRRGLPTILFDCLVESARTGLDSRGRIITLKKRTSTGFAFDKTHPAARDWAAQHSAELVVEVTEQTRVALRAIVAAGFDKGIDVRTMATLIRPGIGLTESQGITLMRRFQELVDSGVSVDAATLTAEKWIDTAIRRRALMIARTETIRAANEGQKQLWRQAIDAKLLPAAATMVWIATAGACPICNDLDGEAQSVIEGTFSGGYDAPPAHPACRCTIGIAVS